MASDSSTDEQPSSSPEAGAPRRVTKGALIGIGVALVAIGGGLYASTRVGPAPEVADALGTNAQQLAGSLDPATLKDAVCKKTSTTNEFTCTLTDKTKLTVVYEDDTITKRLVGSDLDRLPGSDQEVTDLVNAEQKQLAGKQAITYACGTSIGFTQSGTSDPNITGFLCVEQSGAGKAKQDGQSRFLQFASDGSLLRDYVVQLGAGPQSDPTS